MKVIITDTGKKEQYQHLENSRIFKKLPTLNKRDDVEWVLIDQEDSKKIEDYVTALRSNPSTSLVPIFSSHNALDAVYKDLIDGIGLEESELIKTSEHINRTLEELESILDYNDGENILLAYLFTRPDVRVQFKVDPSIPQVIRYPLVEVFLGDKELALNRVNTLAEKGYLVAEKVINEVQLCPYCKRGWINYKSVCPQCHTVDLIKEQFLHCFACGNTDAEGMFLRQGSLICPNCKTRLRHIGIDYDRPLEEYVCRDNHHAFIDPEVLCHCLSCEKEFSPERLISIKLSAYRLSDKGINALINKQNVTTSELKDQHDFFDQSYFILFLDWLIRSCIRYEYMSFSLFNLSIVNYAGLVERYGITQSKQLIDDFFNYLRSYFRSTDLIARVQNEVVTVIFVQTDSESVGAIKHNIENHLNDSEQGDLKIEIHMNSISSDEIELDKYDAKLLLAELNARGEND